MTRRQQDEAQFASFCAVQHPRLVGALTLYCRDPDVAQDLAQETLARVWRDWQRLANVSSLDAYAYRTAINLANSHFRKRAVRRRHRHRVEMTHDAVHEDADAAAAITLRQQLASLEPRRRAAVVLRYFSDLSVADTAEIMQAPENTVKTLTRRALADLRLVFDEQEEHDVS